MLFWLFAGLVLLFGFVVFFGAPYVPSKRRELEQVFAELYKITDQDVLVDIGSGDGVVLRMAAKKGARAVGYELNPALVLISRLLSKRYKTIKAYTANLWKAEFPEETTVVYVFAVERDIEKIARKLQREANRLRKPLSVISYGCAIPHMAALKTLGAHYLYTFAPLHTQ
ncbi:MAG TPA: class I SAM-dependent methyltransferase [Candidatus Saccharimonadales bacterium]|nr:class I SAM-dependent methyltransferase [Candidatus Saccharimonadales bacterium]